MRELNKAIIAATPNCFFGYQPLVAYQQFPALGIHYAEVPAQLSGASGFVPEVMDDSDVQRLRERLEDLGITPVSVGAYSDLLRAQHVVALQRRIDFSQKLGASIVVSASTHQPEIDADQWQRLINTLRFIGDYAADRGVRIALEIHGGITRNGALAARLLDAVNHPSVGVNYDTGNIYYYNDDLDPVDDIRHVADRVFQVHLKDTTGGKGEWQFCALGEGRVNFAAVVATLRSVGFGGSYTLELEGQPGEDLNLEGHSQRIRQSLDYLRKLGLLDT